MSALVTMGMYRWRCVIEGRPPPPSDLSGLFAAEVGKTVSRGRALSPATIRMRKMLAEGGPVEVVVSEGDDPVRIASRFYASATALRRRVSTTTVGRTVRGEHQWVVIGQLQ